MFKVALIANDGHPIPDWVCEKFRQADITFVYQQCYSREDLAACAMDADVVWLQSSRQGLVVEENMDLFGKAGAVIKCGSGTDNIDHEACTKRGVIVAHTPEDPTEATSDHTIAMLLTAVRQTARQDHLVRGGIWDFHAAMPLAKMSGADLGVIGFGRIGRMVIRKLSGFNMTVRVFDPFVGASVIEKAGASKVELDGLLTESRFIIVACPLTKETRGLLGEREFSLTRQDAILVNCARAGIVDEPALIKALKENRIKAAALDVLEKHPLSPGDEWLTLENVNFTPHMGGSGDHYPDEVFESVVDVIIGMSRMRRPKWIVNKGVIPKWTMTP